MNNPLKDPKNKIKRSTGPGALTPNAAKELGPKAVELQKKKAASVDLPKVKKEEVMLVDKILQEIGEEKKGLWANIHAKRKRGEKPAKPGDKDYPKTLNVEGIEQARDNVGADKCWKGKKLGTPKTKMKGGKEVPNCVPEEVVSETCGTKKHGGDAEKPGKNKNYVKEIEESVRMPAKSGNIYYVMVSWRGKVYSLQMFFPSGKRPSRQEVQDQVRKVYPDSKLTYFNMRDYEPGQPLLQVEEAKVDKDKMKCNKPKAQAVGDSLTGKSHVVKACSGGEEKIIRFGQRGVKGSPKKEGESEGYAARRKAFKDRHAKNIAQGKMSAAYWANKVKW
jgi:hypothetical protein